MPISQDQFRAILSGNRRDTTATVLRSLLGVASLGYGMAVSIRNALYDLHILKAHRVDATVLSIGNITTGGTGKTPLVVWLCRTLNQKSKIKNQKYGVAVLTRGYKARSQKSGVRSQNNRDEIAVLARACPGIQVIVNPDRVAGATTAIDQGARILVLDDGFQHRRLVRELDIVALDATLPFGYGRLLPAGLLREPLIALSRAHAVVITRSDQAERDRLEEIERILRQVNPRLVIARAIHAPTVVHQSNDKDRNPADLAGKRVYAFCGIGNPEAFFKTLAKLGAKRVGSMTLDDHHACTAQDLQRIRQEAEAAGADLILTTEKNWLSLEPTLLDGKIPAGYLEIRMELIAGEDGLIGLIPAALEGRISD